MKRAVRFLRVGLAAAAVAALALASTVSGALAQGVQHKAEPWIVSVSHRIDLNQHALQFGRAAPGQDVRLVKPASRHIINLTSGILIDSDGHVVTRLVNLDPRETVHDIQVTTSSGRVIRAKFVGFDGPTGLTLLSVPELRATKPAPGLKLASLAEGEALRVISAEYKQTQITMPVERVALYPALMDSPARASTTAVTPALTRAGVVAVVESAALTSSNDLSSVETTDGRLVGITRFVSAGRAHILGVPFLRDVVARRLLQANGSIAAGWLGADGTSLSDIPQDRRPAGAPADGGVVIRQILPQGPAELAGLRRNDMIVGFDEIPVLSTRDLATAVLNTPAGTNIQVSVIREGKPLTFPAVLGGRPLVPGIPAVVVPGPIRSAELQLSLLRENLARAKDAETRDRLEAEIRRLEAEVAAANRDADPNDAQFDAIFDDRILAELGLSGYALKSQLAQKLGVSGGILIDDVKAGSIGEQSGLKAADVIVKAGETAVASEEELAEAVFGAARAGRTVMEVVVHRDGKSVPLPVPIGKFRRN